jgi:acyl-CoA thioesterase
MLLSEILATLQPAADGHTVAVTEDWRQGRATYGGLVAAVGNEAMRKLVPAERPLRSLQTTFVGPASAGTWSLNTRVLRIGKAVTLTACDILDREQIVATQVGVYGSARNSVVSVRPSVASATRSVEQLRDVGYKPGLAPDFLQHFAIRWSEGKLPFSGSPQTPSKAFIHHRDPAPLTESALVALIDCIPTPAMSMMTSMAPASSLVWTLEFFEHELDFPPDSWWRIDTDLDAAKEGYVNQTGVLIDPNGRPVALSRQLFAIFG